MAPQRARHAKDFDTLLANRPAVPRVFSYQKQESLRFIYQPKIHVPDRSLHDLHGAPRISGF
ncbi:MAG: hypothetical protein ACJ0DJ_09475 [bacterium]